MENNLDLIRELNRKLAKDEVDEVLKILLNFLVKNNKKLYHSAILINNKHEILKKDEALSLIRRDEYNLEKAKVVNSIIYIISELKNSSTNSIVDFDIDEKTKEILRKKLNGLQDKLIFLNDKLIYESNPNQEFKLKKDIKDIEDEIENIKEKISNTKI